MQPALDQNSPFEGHSAKGIAVSEETAGAKAARISESGNHRRETRVGTSLLGRYWHTLRHLRSIQIYARLRSRAFRLYPDLSPPPPLRPVCDGWVEPARRAPSLTGPGQFFFLNEEGDLAQTGWDGPAREKLWRYNQHYFDDLNAEGGQHRHDWHLALIDDWIARNPPGQGLGWEPYPVSLRIVNWIKWERAGNRLPPGMAASLAVQARWLAARPEWHLLGNHLFANAKALIFAGLFFAGQEADRWLRLGFRILEKQFSEQILADGGHFERSPMYHALALEDVLDLLNICAGSEIDLQAKHAAQVEHWRSTIPAMVRWLRVLCHPDGEIAFFNDAAIGIAPRPLELFSYADRLGFQPVEQIDALIWLRDTGYVRLENGSGVLIADAAPLGPDYLPGHAHADTLSFELSLQKRRVVVNSGTSVYGLSAERHRQRGTAAHSTLILDEQNSSDVWSGFRVGRRAYPVGVEAAGHEGNLRLEAAHNGYRHLTGRPLHRRTWHMVRGELRVTDAILGSGRHDAEIRFHFAPGLKLVRQPDNIWSLFDEQDETPVASITCQAEAVAVISSTWHPTFGSTRENLCLRVALAGHSPFHHETVFRWDEGIMTHSAPSDFSRIHTECDL